jgi:hypothetical protein
MSAGRSMRRADEEREKTGEHAAFALISNEEDQRASAVQRLSDLREDRTKQPGDR